MKAQRATGKLGKAVKLGGLPCWNLAELFSSPADPAINKTVARAAARADRFARRYRGSVVAKLGSAGKLSVALEEYEQILMEAAKPITYAGLLFSQESTLAGRGGFLQQMRTSYADVMRLLTFFEVELAAFGPKKLKLLGGAHRLSRFRNYLAVIARGAPHRLSEREEQILNDKNLTGRSGLVRLFQEEHAHKRYGLKIAGKNLSLSQAQVLNRLYSTDRQVRRRAAAALTDGLKKESRRLGFIYNTLALDKSIDDRYRRFTAPEDSRHQANQVERKVVEVMTDVVTERYALVGRFYRFKRKLMAVQKLYDYDRYAPVVSSRQRYSFGRARGLIIAAAEKFSVEYAGIVDLFFRNRWIDAELRPGKQAGAFCHSVTPDLHPFILVNYTGTLREVFTLAHELGHGVHAWLAREQGYLNSEVPLTVCETASIFGEMLLFDHMAEIITDPTELLSLHLSMIENIFATVFRQVAMYRFEQDFHAARRKGEELSPAAINSLWRKRQQEMFKRSVTLTEGYDWWWSYIPHFVHTPFYVYAYAFGELLTLSLYARYKSEGERFVPMYMDMLRAGGSRSPAELVKTFGVTLSKRSFWEGGMDMIAELVRRTEGFGR